MWRWLYGHSSYISLIFKCSSWRLDWKIRGFGGMEAESTRALLAKQQWCFHYMAQNARGKMHEKPCPPATLSLIRDKISPSKLSLSENCSEGIKWCCSDWWTGLICFPYYFCIAVTEKIFFIRHTAPSWNQILMLHLLHALHCIMYRTNQMLLTAVGLVYSWISR